jgi:hypothetical protein
MLEMRCEYVNCVWLFSILMVQFALFMNEIIGDCNVDSIVIGQLFNIRQILKKSGNVMC